MLDGGRFNASAGVPRPAIEEPRFRGLATGESGDVDLERSFLDELEAIYKMFCKKQRDYGRGNIAKFGELGVAVRVNDKVERLANLIKKGRSPMNESTLDTWQDIGCYALIALMCKKGSWPQAWMGGPVGES